MVAKPSRQKSPPIYDGVQEEGRKQDSVCFLFFFSFSSFLLPLKDDLMNGVTENSSNELNFLSLGC